MATLASARRGWSTTRSAALVRRQVAPVDETPLARAADDDVAGQLHALLRSRRVVAASRRPLTFRIQQFGSQRGRVKTIKRLDYRWQRKTVTVKQTPVKT